MDCGKEVIRYQANESAGNATGIKSAKQPIASQPTAELFSSSVSESFAPNEIRPTNSAYFEPTIPCHSWGSATSRTFSNSGFQMPLSNQRQSRFSNTFRTISKNILKENNLANDGQRLCYRKRGDQRTSVRVCKRETYSLNSGRDSASELAIPESGNLSTS